MEDMERMYYSDVGAQYIQKADAPVLTTTSGVYNPVFGAMVWNQLNIEANAFGMLPKYVWNRSGFRAISARASHSSYGISEGGAMPDTVKPTFQEISTKPKTIATNFDVSEVQDYLSTTSVDDVFGSMEQLRPIMGADHREAINEQLLTDFDTLASNNFESLDRVTASTSEQSGVSATVGDEDLYGVDRSANSWFDGQSNHNSNVDRAITDELIRTLLANLRNNGANTTVGLTGHDTYSKIQGIYDTYVRYTAIGESHVQFGVNGIQTAAGVQVGIHIPSLYNVPTVVSKNTPQDTISRLYFLDTSDPEGFGYPRLGIMVAKPTQYFEAGVRTGTPIELNKWATEGAYRTMGELIARFPKAQGKLRDLK